jgi:hypothetical protein
MSSSVRQVYKEALEGYLHLSDKSIKRLLKDVFIYQTEHILQEPLYRLICQMKTYFTSLFIDLSDK